MEGAKKTLMEWNRILGKELMEKTSEKYRKEKDIMRTNEPKSKEEIALAKLRMNIIKQMEECVSENDAHKASSYATVLSLLPIYLDYKVNE